MSVVRGIVTAVKLVTRESFTGKYGPRNVYVTFSVGGRSYDTDRVTVHGSAFRYAAAAVGWMVDHQGEIAPTVRVGDTVAFEYGGSPPRAKKRLDPLDPGPPAA